MLYCKICEQKAVQSNYCKDHFIDYFEKNVKTTIKRFNLLKKSDKIIVGASGGKDSLTVLYLLNKYGYNVTALAIDEGIKGYRDSALSDLKAFCTKYNVKLKVVSFKNLFNKSLDQILFKDNERPCTTCGIFRRYLLNKYSKGFDKLVTGHNMDDEAQAIIMNLIKNNINSLKRQGPIAGLITSKNFTPRVKPLYLCSEKEVMVYAFLQGLTTKFNECPNVAKAFRLRVRDYLNNLEQKNPGAKNNIVKWFLSYKKTIRPQKLKIGKCQMCGENSSNKICKACEYKELKCL